MKIRKTDVLTIESILPQGEKIISLEGKYFKTSAKALDRGIYARAQSVLSSLDRKVTAAFEEQQREAWLDTFREVVPSFPEQCLEVLSVTQILLIIQFAGEGEILRAA